MILIIDNQSSYIRRFRQDVLAGNDIPYHFVDHDEEIDIGRAEQYTGVILTGGKGNPYTPLNLTANFVALHLLDLPTIGFCLGHEVIAVFYGARIRKLPEAQRRIVTITIDALDDPLFEGLAQPEFRIQKKHQWEVTGLRSPLISLGHSSVTANEVIRHQTKPIWGFQGHPEVHTDDGDRVMRNFLALCGFDTR